MRRYTTLILLVMILSASLAVPHAFLWAAEQTQTKETTKKRIPAKTASRQTSTTSTAAKATKKSSPAAKKTTKNAEAKPAASQPITKVTTKPAASPPAKAAAPEKKKSQGTAKSTGKKSYRSAQPKKSAVASSRRVKKPSRPAPACPPAVQGGVEGRISAKSFMVMDDQTGGTIYTRSPDSPRQPASTIKIVTGLIALKTLQNDSILTVSNKAAGMPSSKVSLDPKRSYRANDLINALLLASANDAAVALAENIAGSEEKFANMMTMSARMWGAENTIARTASGLTAEGQQSTARDLATLFRYAMQHEDFARRMREKKMTTSYGKSLLNHNKALWRIDGAVGGKTGYTVAARQTYVGKFTRDGVSIIVAVMGCESMWADVAKLVEYGFAHRQQLAGQ